MLGKPGERRVADAVALEAVSTAEFPANREFKSSDRGFFFAEEAIPEG